MDLSDEVVEIADRDSDSSQPPHGIDEVGSREGSKEDTREENQVKVQNKGVGWFLSIWRRKTQFSKTSKSEDEVDGPLAGQGLTNQETSWTSGGINMKKTAASGLMDIAFLTANANQLNQAINWPTSKNQTLVISLISISIGFQVLAAVLLIVTSYIQSQPPDEIADDNIEDAKLAKAKQKARTRRLILIDHVTISLVFFIAVVNLFIVAFSSGSQQYGAPTTPQQ